MSAVMPAFARWAVEWLDPLVQHLWVSTLFLGFVLALALLLRGRLTASSRFAIVAVGIVKFAIPAAPLVAAIRGAGGESALVAELGAGPVAAFGDAFRIDAAPATPSGWAGVLMAVWVAGTAFLLARAMLVRLRLERLAIRSAVAPSAREAAALERARRRLGVRRSVDLVRGAFAEAPAVLGVLRPLIILPREGCPELSDDELEAVLAHEVAHVRRHDNLVARLEFLLCSLFWFNPLLWIARRLTLLDRERASDEAVAASEGGGEVYLDALSKFCLATIAPRLPGVSCMATAKLKERIDYVMNYPRLRTSSPSAPRMTFLASLALLVFSSAAGIVAASGTGEGNDPFAVKIAATRAGDLISVEGEVTDNRTGTLVAAPRLTVDAGGTGRAGVVARGLEVEFVVAPGAGSDLAVDVAVRRDGAVLQKTTMRIVPRESAAEEEPKYTGQPMTLQLTDAELRDVFSVFSRLTGLPIEVDAEVSGKVSVNWQNVPWDRALEELITGNGLQYRLENGTMYVSKK